jgi:hypothetical protein
MSQVTVGSSTVVTITSSNPARISIIIINTHSSANLFLDSSPLLTTATAGLIIPAGGCLTEDSGGDKMYQGPYYALSGEDSIDVRYWERNRRL